MDNVVPIVPRALKPKGTRKPVQRFRHVEDVLDRHQMRIYEAAGVAHLLRARLADPPASDFSSEDIQAMENATTAILRLLNEIHGLGSFLDLVSQNEMHR